MTPQKFIYTVLLPYFDVYCRVCYSSDIVCELPCLLGQYCDEVTGQCICDSSLRDEEWCWKRQSTANYFQPRFHLTLTEQIKKDRLIVVTHMY